MTKNAISNSTEKSFQNYPIRWNKNLLETYGFKHFFETRNIQFFFVPMDWIWRSLIQRDSFYYFSRWFLPKPCFFEVCLVTWNPSYWPSKMLRTARFSVFRMRPKMTSKPTHLIRNDNIQSGATPCIVSIVSRHERFPQKEHSKNQRGSGAVLLRGEVEDLVANKVTREWVLRQNFNNPNDEWLWGRLWWLPVRIQRRTQKNHWLEHIAQSRHYNFQQEVESQQNSVQHSRLSSRSWSKIFWTLLCWKKQNEDQHWRIDLSEQQQRTLVDLTENPCVQLIE